MTYTYVTLEVSPATYDEIAAKLREADYHHCFNSDGEIDMHGLALVRGPANQFTIEAYVPPSGEICPGEGPMTEDELLEGLKPYDNLDNCGND